MAVNKTINIDIENNADEAAKDFEKLSDSVGGVDKQVEDLNKNAKGSVSGFKKMSSAAKGLGTAFKAAGIGLVVAGLAALKSSFESNQSTANKFAEIMETIGIVFSQTVGAIIDAVNATSKATGGFKSLGKVMGGIIDIALAPFQLAFYGIKLGILELQLAWEKSVFGSGDVSTINRLNKSLKETRQDIKDVGVGVLEAGAAIIDNLGGAVDEIAMLTTSAIEEVKDVSIKAANEQAKQLVEARNNAAIAAAEQARLVEIYDRQAEQQRQIRDEERNSITERIAANEKLGEVLEKQEKAMLAQANMQVQAAKLEFERNKTTETRVALTEALANREGVLAQVEGLRSEQKANDLALDREIIELTNLQSESEATLAIERKKATNELLDDQDKVLQGKLDILEEEREIELARLQLVIDSANEGTLAKLEAEIEYNTKKQELDLEQLAIEKEISDRAVANNKESNEKQKADDQLLQDAKFKMAQDGLALISNITQLFGQKSEKQAKRAFQIDKAAKIASATMSGIEGTINAYKTAQDSPITALLPVYPVIQAGLAAAFAATNIAAIGQQKFEGGGPSPDVSAGGGGGVQAPSFNVVGDSGVNQLAELQQQPTQAYVVSGEVTTAQALDRNRVQNATL
jgi:hypothetical protein